jgi:hypothetical protein
LKADGLQDEIVLNYKPDSGVANATLSDGKLQVIVLEMTRGVWPYFVAGLLGIICLTYLWYNIYRTNCASFQSNMKIVLHLQFLTGSSSVFIPISPIVFGVFDDYEVECKKYIAAIRITGILKPRLRFNWRHLYLINVLTGKRVLIKESHRLSWINAFKLRRLVRKPYAIMLVLIHENSLQRVKPNEVQGEGASAPPDRNLLSIESLEFV